jgi:hypothetical protein
MKDFLDFVSRENVQVSIKAKSGFIRISVTHMATRTAVEQLIPVDSNEEQVNENLANMLDTFERNRYPKVKPAEPQLDLGLTNPLE